IRMAFIDGEPVGMLGAFPDPYYALQPRWRWYGDSDYIRVLRLLSIRKKIPRIRLMFFGIHPDYRFQGIDALLLGEVRDYAVKQGYQTCEASLLLETNKLILKPLQLFGARQYKTWRIYELPLN
ncbi:MAG: N-acetyltransferase, partial [Chloroflexi bacterium]|nr:N-acetyltransferase [Chloroflexota bacterium]